MFLLRIKSNFGAKFGFFGRADVGNRDVQFPLPRGNRAGKIGRSRVRFADGEVAFVSSAIAAKALRIGDAEIERGLVILSGVTEIDADAMCARRYGERNFEIRLVLRAGNFAVKNQVGSSRLCCGDRAEKD